MIRTAFPTRELARRALLTLLAVALAGAGAPPDLRVEWLDGSGTPSSAPAIRGEAGSTVRIPYRIRNVGGSDAFAVIVRAQTALGDALRPLRLEPGPRAGRALERSFQLALAEGMREVCVDVRLQTREADDPRDPRPADDRACRRVEVEAPSDDGAARYRVAPPSTDRPTRRTP